ncbi:MAG: AAA family ATPase [Desulfobacteraceae bacterium]|nr:MAG: AAA family ATPase [Desulfobacteraceae bacterium]
MDKSSSLYLEDVNIQGFKSFSELTNMGFQPGIGVIIGNNGVGKSNILDAIVWTLGEDDLTRLRCYEKGELFFSGSKNYPPASQIRVELIFKRGKEKKAPAVRLVRDMTKDGQDDYWVKDERLEREEYLQELINLKAPHALKSIIRQEQINDMILLDPWQRFHWVENLLSFNGTEDLAQSIQGDIDPLFRKYLEFLFPLGEGELKVLEQNGRKGLEIEVTLPGNRKRKSHQLSGGEKSVTSLALKLAIFEQLDSPFYLLDEVEPSLDYTNHKSMQALLRTLALKKQLIIITHLRSTIQLANTVHGVRTRWDGSSFMKFYFVMDERLLRLYKCC